VVLCDTCAAALASCGLASGGGSRLKRTLLLLLLLLLSSSCTFVSISCLDVYFILLLFVFIVIVLPSLLLPHASQVALKKIKGGCAGAAAEEKLRKEVWRVTCMCDVMQCDV